MTTKIPMPPPPLSLIKFAYNYRRGSLPCAKQPVQKKDLSSGNEFQNFDNEEGRSEGVVLMAIQPLSTPAEKRKGNISGGPSMAMTVTGVCLVCVCACVHACVGTCVRACACVCVCESVYVSVYRIFTFLLHLYDILSCECFTAALVDICIIWFPMFRILTNEHHSCVRVARVRKDGVSELPGW